MLRVHFDNAPELPMLWIVKLKLWPVPTQVARSLELFAPLRAPCGGVFSIARTLLMMYNLLRRESSMAGHLQYAVHRSHGEEDGVLLCRSVKLP